GPPEAIDPETIETMTTLQAWVRDEELHEQEAAIKADHVKLAAELAEDLRVMRESTRTRKELDEKRNVVFHGKAWGSEAVEATWV
ncbi:hypothetical protein GGI21_003322, partial [Coemansia aciculifera]